MKIHFEPAGGSSKTISLKVPVVLWTELQEAREAALRAGLGKVNVSRHLVVHLQELVQSVNQRVEEEDGKKRRSTSAG